MLGVSATIWFLPLIATYQGGVSGTSISIIDATHPLLINPNTLSSTVDYEGYFTTLSGNLTVLSTDGTNPVTIAGVRGNGKIALSTTQPSGTELTNCIENAISWSSTPSLIIKSATKNQEIIWEGDVVTITLNISDFIGNPISEATVTAWLNDSAVTVTESGSGSYTITLGGDWTNGRPGYFALRVHTIKAGYDTLSIVLLDFVYIRSSPFLALAIIGGGVIAVAVAWQLVKRRRGDSEPTKSQSPKERKLSKEQKRLKKKEEEGRKKRQREADKKSDAKEFFGVE